MSTMNTPVLVGVGLTTQREADPNIAAEPLALMIQAAEAAAHDAEAPALLNQLDRVLVPMGRWGYGNPASMIAAALGSAAATSVCAAAGVSQQTLLSNAASAIATGEITTALVVGGEGGHRLRQARIAGVDAHETPNDETPDLWQQPDVGMVQQYEHDAGLSYVPANYYALMESAWRAANNLSLDQHRDLMADRYHRFSQTAAANPHGWDQEVTAWETIRNSAYMAFPYTRHHLSNWSVDQASALIMTSTAEAQRLGIPETSWVYPHAFTECNHITNVTARTRMHESVGAQLAGAAVLEAAGCEAADLDHVELYSCFPVAVEAYREALGIKPEADVSFTGAMPFAGGPFNNFVLHATAQLAQRLRAEPGSRGLVTTVSGFMTKQGFAVWGTEPNANAYTFVDVTDEAANVPVMEIDTGYAGPAVIVAYTVIHTKAGAERGVIVADTPNGTRALASSQDPALLADMETREFCGLTVTVTDGSFVV